VREYGVPGHRGTPRRVADAATRQASSVDDLLDSIITELTGDEPADDVALIGLRWLT
jgi:hypothetical protein